MSFSGNSNFLNAAAVAVEQRITNTWRSIWTSAHPFLQILEMQGTNFNKGFTVQRNAMILGILGDDQTNPVAGVATGSGELVAMSYNVTNALSQAKYYFGHYRGNYTILESEATTLANGERGNLLEGKKMQFNDSWLNKASTDFASTTIDASDNSKALGLYYVLSTSNSPGGISQSTDTQWAAQLKTGAGAFDLMLVDDMLDGIAAKSNMNRKGKPDVLLCSYTASNNVWGKFKNSIAPNERFTHEGFSVKFGIDNVVYRGATGVQDPRIGSTLNGSIAVLTSSVWYAAMQKAPKLHPLAKIPGTDAYEQVGTIWAGLGCNDPALNGLIRDIS